MEISPQGKQSVPGGGLCMKAASLAKVGRIHYQFLETRRNTCSLQHVCDHCSVQLTLSSCPLAVLSSRSWCCWTSPLTSPWWMRVWPERSSTASRNYARRWDTITGTLVALEAEWQLTQCFRICSLVYNELNLTRCKLFANTCIWSCARVSTTWVSPLSWIRRQFVIQGSVFISLLTSSCAIMHDN